MIPSPVGYRSGRHGLPLLPPLLVLLLLLPLLAAACDPYGHWPDPAGVFPHVYTPETKLRDWDPVRWETETWTPADASMAGLYLKKIFNPRKGAPVESLQHFELMRPQIPALGGGGGAAAAGPTLSLVGDVMWVGGNWKDFARGASKLLDGDLRVGNLETPTSPDHPTGSMALGLYSFNAPPEMLTALPLDVLQLNNNHSLDADDLGLQNTLKQVKAAGYQQTGVDSQLTVTTAGRRIALLAYTWGINGGARSKAGHELQIIPFGHLDEAIDLSSLSQQVARARGEGADDVVVLLHWGFEYEYFPDPHFMVLARRIVAAGADLVVGQGPHVVQPAELCHVNNPDVAPGVGSCSVRSTDGDDRRRTAAVLYSLGNFGTTQPLACHEVGLVATVRLADGGPAGLGWAGVVSETLKSPETGQRLTSLADLQGDATYAAEGARLEQHLGARWKR